MANCGRLWEQFAEFYGAKALEAKYGAVPPDAWKRDIGRLNDFELERGLNRLKRIGKPHIPVLPEFLRLCREVTTEHDAQPQNQNGQKLPPLPRFDELANVHLMGFIWSRTAERNKITGEQQYMKILVDTKNMWAEQMREWEQEQAIPADHGRALWNEMMRGAETSIDLVRA